MADRNITDRLQPSLLDRLTDMHPGEMTEKREDRVIDVRRLRDIVQRDLSWLLNTTSHESLLDAALYPNVVRSVINYGLREVAGGASGLERANEIRLMIRRAIERFEPRLKPDSIEVSIVEDKTASGATLTYDIRADMWAQPVPLELYMRSEVNIATGELTLERTG